MALYDERGLLAESNWLAGSNHSVQLLPGLEHLLSLQQVEVRSLRAVGVALGPGSFNGLRVAVSTAKGLCLALGLPFLGVGTLAATAYQHRLAGRPVCALVDAGRGQLYGTIYPADARSWPAEGAGGILPLADLVSRVDQPTVFCGELSEGAAALLSEWLGDLALLATPATSLRRAACLAELAWARFAAGESDDLARVQPLYLRRLTGQPS